MGYFWKATAGVLVAVVLGLSLDRQGKDFFVLLTMAVCAMAAGAAFLYLEPVLDFLCELEALSQLQEDMLGILLKCVGIGVVAELASMICNDSGNTSLGKQLQMLGSSVILYLSVPVFRSLLELIQDILGEV